MPSVRFGDEADDEYAEAVAWYAARSARAAAGFEVAVAEAVGQIGQAPTRFAECDPAAHPGFRYAPLGEYPYSLIFHEVGMDVHVVAVAHSRRRPGYWSGRA